MAACSTAWRGLLVSVALAAGCASTGGAVPGQTRADRRLQLDTLRMMKTLDATGIGTARTYGACDDWKVVNTEVVETLRDAQFDGGRLAGGSWVERWTIDRCGTQVRYRVSYEAARNGTSFALQLER